MMKMDLIINNFPLISLLVFVFIMILFYYVYQVIGSINNLFRWFKLYVTPFLCILIFPMITIILLTVNLGVNTFIKINRTCNKIAN